MKKLLTTIVTIFLVLGLTIGNVFAADEAQWEEKAPMSEERTNPGSCAIGDKIYVLGGRNDAGITDSVEIYDTKTDSWSYGEPMPEKLHYYTVAAVDDKIYTFGGRDDTNSIIVGSVYVYDIKNNTWTIAEPMPTARCCSASAVIGKEIYVIAGTTSIDRSKVVEIYNTETNSWRTGNSINYQRELPSAAVVDNNIYVLGGYEAAKYLDTMEIYNLESGVWSVGTPLPTTIGFFSASVIDDKIYVTGGFDGTDRLNTVYIYSTTQKTWENGVPLLGERSGHCSEAVGGQIYVIGGWIGSGGSATYLNTVESLMVTEENTTHLSVLLNIGEDVQLGVSYNLSDNTDLSWSSSDKNIATVDANGKVTAVGVGEAYIYAENSDGTFKDSIPIRVVEANADELRLAVNLNIGGKADLYLSDDASLVVWSSMDESVATVSERGQVTAAKKGLAIIQGELEDKDYQIYVRCC